MDVLAGGTSLPARPAPRPRPRRPPAAGPAADDRAVHAARDQRPCFLTCLGFARSVAAIGSSKRLKKGLPRYENPAEVDKHGNPTSRVLMLNVVAELAGHSTDRAWIGSKANKKRYENVLGEYRKGVTEMASDMDFIVRCFDLLDGRGRDELPLPQLVRWVTLLLDPGSSGGGGDGDIDIQADMMQKLGKAGQQAADVVVDWQDFVLVTLDFYVVAGAFAMRRTFDELCADKPAARSSSDGSLVPHPPEGSKNSSLAEDVRAARAVRSLPPRSPTAWLGLTPGCLQARVATAESAAASVGSGGGRSPQAVKTGSGALVAGSGGGRLFVGSP